jgi:hypothetical protein
MSSGGFAVHLFGEQQSERLLAARWFSLEIGLCGEMIVEAGEPG